MKLIRLLLAVLLACRGPGRDRAHPGPVEAAGRRGRSASHRSGPAPRADCHAGPSPTPTLSPAQHEAAAAALLAKGKSQRADGDYEPAIASLAEAVSLHPNTPSVVEARFQLGECYRFKEESRRP